MTRPPRQIKLGAFLMQTGHHIAAWRHPGAQADAAVNFRHYVDLARRAEAAKFDAIFLADAVGVRNTDLPSLSRTARSDHFEPLTLLSALAAVTEKIGLIATVSTTYNEPYHVARKFASLDQISGGRSGWNLVTSSGQGEAQNFSLDEHVEHAQLYARAADPMTWCWGCGTAGRTTPSCATPTAASTSTRQAASAASSRRALQGARPAQRGALAARPPGGGAGRRLARRPRPGRAQRKVIFVAHQTFDEAQSFYRDIKRRAAGYGRDPDSIKVMPGIFPVVGHSQAEADEKFARLQDLIHPVVGVQLLSNMIGVDLSGHPVDGPLPELPETNGGRSRQLLLADLARRDGLTIRQLYLKIAGARDHQQVVGTPARIADQLQQWFEEEGADGFNIMSPWLPGGLDDFIELVLPELRRRGLFRREYAGSTLREHLGLARPAHVPASARAQRPAIAA